MSVQLHATAFMRANDASPVVAGYAIEPDPRRTPQGCVYLLEDGSQHRLPFDVCRALPAPYPKWALG